ncbi:phage protein NinX family protein [Enterobacter sp. 18A13]|uniref:phage protein NinX family protein n=1 Tax=Enterobacter sp. 18A13 TaxID=2565914 RepID=UPI0010CA5B56|nr:phage protein NinX family protein [Enterobacter sp. 18A13]BBJ66304.1 hypothetical protein ECC18A13_008690 [Enterobacter sp. 18A13]
MDYSQLSDQEINAMVGKIVSKDGLSIIASDGNAVIHEYADCGEFKGICLGWKVFDPCHSPADAWPIIESNGITIINDKNCFPRATNDSFAFINEQYDECLHALAGNPLRAAMIVFLMMQEANHA